MIFIVLNYDDSIFITTDYRPENYADDHRVFIAPEEMKMNEFMLWKKMHYKSAINIREIDVIT